MRWKSKFFFGWAQIDDRAHTHFSHVFKQICGNGRHALFRKACIICIHQHCIAFSFELTRFCASQKFLFENEILNAKGRRFFLSRISKRVKSNDINKTFYSSILTIANRFELFFPRSAFETIKWFVFSVRFEFCKTNGEKKKLTRES